MKPLTIPETRLAVLISSVAVLSACAVATDIGGYSGDSSEPSVAEEKVQLASHQPSPSHLQLYAAPKKSAQLQFASMPGWGAPADLEQTNTYRETKENSIKKTVASPLSTFSIDVDTASYIRAQSYLERGLIPPIDSIRTEEFINAQTYSYAAANSREDPISIHTEMGANPWNDRTSLLQIGLKAYEIEMASRAPANLVFLVDVSGSMNAQDKLPLLKQALKSTLPLLNEKDVISIVTYSGSNEVVLEGVKGNEHDTIMGAIENMSASGSTNMGDGMRGAYRIAQKYATDNSNNRILLVTDGDLNVGMSEKELVDFAKKEKDNNIDLTVLGFGNYGYHDAALENLSNKADGQYYFINNYHTALKTMNSAFMGSLYHVAEDVKIQVEFNPQQVAEYRLIGYENRALASEDFNNDKKDAGDMGSGHTVTALYEIVWADRDFRFIDDLKYGAKHPQADDGSSREVATVKLRYKQPGAQESTLKTHVVHEGLAHVPENSASFHQAVSAAAFSQMLRQSELIGEFKLDTLNEWIAQQGASMPKDLEEMMLAYAALNRKS